jgi:hypothetical protein
MECDCCGNDADFNLVIQTRTSGRGAGATAYPICNDCREFIERSIARRHRTQRALNADQRDTTVQEINETMGGQLESKYDARKQSEGR